MSALGLMTRRTFIGVALASLRWARVAGASPSHHRVLPPDEDAFLEDLARRAVQYFWEQGDPRTGLVRDRARVDGSTHVPDRRDVASIAATGFGLAALAIAHERRWRNAPEIKYRVRRTLAFLAHDMPHEHGWFFHFVRAQTG